MKDYQPIDCDLYSRYELAILRRQRLRTIWRDQQGCYHLRVLQPLNLRSRAHCEYLLARTETGHILELRLDQILRANALLTASETGQQQAI